MDQALLSWIKAHTGEVVSSPRKQAKDFEIVDVDEVKERVRIRFEGKKYIALPLTFEMFNRALSLIRKKNGDWVIIGASVSEQRLGTIEGEIWKRPFPINYNTPFKAASHVCDFLVLAGLTEYGKVVNPISGRNVQSIRLITENNRRRNKFNGAKMKKNFSCSKCGNPYSSEDRRKSQFCSYCGSFLSVSYVSKNNGDVLKIDENKLRKFRRMMDLLLSKTEIPEENNWKGKSNNDIWLAIVAQVMVVGRSSPYEKFVKRTDLQSQIMYDALIQIEDETELSRKINSVLLAVGTRYASITLSKCRKTRALVDNFKKLRSYDNGPIGFLKRLSEFPTDKLRIKYVMTELKFLKNKGARDFLMELGIVKNAVALDSRIQNILQEMGIQTPGAFASSSSLYAQVEKDILEKICKPLGISGVTLDRILYQNYEDCLAIAAN